MILKIYKVLLEVVRTLGIKNIMKCNYVQTILLLTEFNELYYIPLQ